MDSRKACAQLHFEEMKDFSNAKLIYSLEAIFSIKLRRIFVESLRVQRTQSAALLEVFRRLLSIASPIHNSARDCGSSGGTTSPASKCLISSAVSPDTTPEM